MTGQMYGAPKSILKIGADAPGIINKGTGQEMNTFDYCNMVLRTLSNVTGLTLPKGVEYAQVSNSGDLGRFFEGVVNYCDKSIYRAILLPGLTASENSGKGGSRALGGTHFQMFDISEDYIVACAEESFIGQPIRRLIDWNFGVQEDGDYGTFQKDELDPETTLTLSNAMHNAVMDGALDLQEIEDLDFYREKVGAPTISDEGRQSRFDRKQASDAREQLALAAKVNTKPIDVLNPKDPGDSVSPAPAPDKSLFSRLNGVESFFIDVEEI